MSLPLDPLTAKLHSPSQKLRVHCQPAVQTVPWSRHQPHSKLMLIHDDCCPECWPMCQQLEGEGAGDVVRNVCHTEVEVGQVNLHEVPVDDLQLLLVGSALHTP